MRRKAPLVLAGVLAVQALLSALVFTPAPHTGGDNAGYVTLAYSLAQRGTYQELWDPAEPPHTKYPPVFPLLLGGLIAVGVKGWVGLKSVSFAATLLAGLFAFLWARGRGGLLMGAGVALLLALSDGVLYYSRWILSDPLFLALTLGALWALEKGARPASAAGSPAPPAPAGARDRPGKGVGPPGPEPFWLALGFALAVLAYFTRSAGLPLVAATLLWLGWGKRWKALAGCAAAFAVPAFLWWLRGKVQGGSAYVAEFWLVDPYRPELGRVGPPGLLLRVWENLASYVTNLIPEGIVGLEGPFLAPLGLLLTLLALLGWLRSRGRGRWVGDLFFPLYFGLMLLWPVVWSGDRFALPLLPFLLLYAGSALIWLMEKRSPVLGQGVVGVGFLLLALPALGSWAGESASARGCAETARAGDPWACYPSAIREYVALARWSGENLPDGAVVVTRKPRIFFVLSGIKARSLPLTTDPDAFLERAREGGGRYLTMDRWDGLAGYYLPPVLQARPRAFCAVMAMGPQGEGGTLLLGLPDVPPPAGEGNEEEEGILGLCGRGMLREPPRPRVPPSGAIPLLVSGER